MTNSPPIQTQREKERTQELVDWLLAGAPHKGVVRKFSMRTFRSPLLPNGQVNHSLRNDPSTPATCGTCCCMAGAVVQFEATRQKKSVQALLYRLDQNLVLSRAEDHRYSMESTRFVSKAANLLGMDFETANDMFINATVLAILHCEEMEEDPIAAAKVLQHWQKTGIVDWGISVPSLNSAIGHGN